MGDLSTVCPCGHKACFHPSQAQQTARLADSGGQYSGECKGGTVSVHCRCITPREEVIANG